MSLIKRIIKEPNKKEKIKYWTHRIRKLYKRENSYIPHFSEESVEIVSSKPKVTILLPIYNHAKVAKFAVKSILKQTYENIELVILDDGSTDNLLEILKPYYNNEKVHIYSQKNQKLPRALTHLHNFVTGDFITWTSADNIMHPEMIENLVKEIMINPEAALVYGDIYLIDKNNKPYYGICRDTDRDVRKPKIVRLLRNEKPLSLGLDNYINASFLYRKDNSDAITGRYGDDIIGAEDYDYWLRLEKTGNLVHIKKTEPLYYYRVHDNSMSHELETKKAKIHQSRLNNLQEYEQRRIDWCNLRPDVNISTKLSKEEKDYLLKNLNKLPVNINNNKSDKEIFFSNESLKNKAYFKIDENHLILFNGEEQKEVVKIFKGIDLPREMYKSRNPFSHSYYHDDLIRIKKPIFGTHINCENINIENIEKVLINNKDIFFVIMDEQKNDKVQLLIEKHNNFLYYPLKEFGKEYQAYSYFARIINFDDNIENNYKNLLLGYATGRKINYEENNTFFEKFPFTIKYNSKIDFFENDNINDNCYEIMDKYINFYSEKESIERCLKFYNGYTQEMYIKRPKYEVDSIPKESEPYKVN